MRITESVTEQRSVLSPHGHPLRPLRWTFGETTSVVEVGGPRAAASKYPHSIRGSCDRMRTCPNVPYSAATWLPNVKCRHGFAGFLLRGGVGIEVGEQRNSGRNSSGHWTDWA